MLSEVSIKNRDKIQLYQMWLGLAWLPSVCFNKLVDNLKKMAKPHTIE